MLVAVVGATIVSAAARARRRDRPTVGTLPQGFPTPALPWTQLADVGPLLVAAVGITLVSLTDTIATSSASRPAGATRSTRTRRWSASARPTSPPGSFAGFAVSTSGSRTAVAEQSGAKSQLTGLVGAGLVGGAPAVPQRPARRPPAVGAGGGRHRRRALAAGRRRGAPLLAGPALGARCSRWSPRWA